MFGYIPATSALRLKYEIWKQNAGKNTVIVRVYVYGLSEAYVRAPSMNALKSLIMSVN